VDFSYKKSMIFWVVQMRSAPLSSIQSKGISMIRVFLLDDHALVRAGYRMILQNELDIEVIGEAASGEEGLPAIKKLLPDVVLCDLHLPGISGLEVTERLIKGQVGPKVVIVSVQEEGPMPKRLLEAGASAYVGKACDARELLKAIREAARGKRYVGGELAQRFEPSSRLQTWSGAWQTFRSHPWLGVGPGVDVTHVRYVNASGAVEQLTDAHNTWLSILAQQGALGLVTFLILTAWLVLPLGNADALPTRNRWLFSGLAFAFAYGVLYPGLSGSFEDTRHVWVLLGLLAAVPHLPARGRRCSWPHLPPRFPARGRRSRP